MQAKHVRGYFCRQYCKQCSFIQRPPPKKYQLNSPIRDEFRHGSRRIYVTKRRRVTARWMLKHCRCFHRVPPLLPQSTACTPSSHSPLFCAQLKSSWPTRDTLCPTPAARWGGATWLASCSPCSAATPGSRGAWPWPPNKTTWLLHLQCTRSPENTHSNTHLLSTQAKYVPENSFILFYFIYFYFYFSANQRWIRHPNECWCCFLLNQLVTGNTGRLGGEVNAALWSI